ncbi:hypothetical protein TNCT_111231 [Trichonephila clavata]|uniref:Uncharacterized protein n=1 Tax=Trichonephila clavata TaxID=2740835 RepID=A0A8X6HZM1_TRICU|nr:hypothetical protein TNCT_111231 [Trichonephila clavata]
MGLYMLPNSLKGTDYLIFLEQVCPEELEKLLSLTGTHSFQRYQQSGYPTRFSLFVRNHFNIHFARYGLPVIVHVLAGPIARPEVYG